ncbi:MAG TPA: hypothetical protein VGP96_13305 [Candidatus Dormibacteraeota bacterium]|nr:hypothetical protein [Candidatus Dormibacteraeota bacterium]
MQSGEPEGPQAPPEGAPVPPPPAPSGWPAPPGWAPAPAPPGWPPPQGAPVWPPPPQGAPGWPPPEGAIPPPGWGPASAVPGWNPGVAAATTGFGRFRPMGIGELLDAAFALYRRNLLLLVAITAVVQVPFAVLNLALFQLLGVGSDLDAAGARGPFATLGNSGSTLTDAQVAAFKSLTVYFVIVFAVQMFVVLPLSLAAMSRAVSDRYLDRPASLGTSYRAALRRGGALLGAILLLLLLVAGITAAMFVGIVIAALLGPIGVVPAIGVGIAWMVALPVLAVRSTLFAQTVVVEGSGSLGGLRRSWRLTQGFFWRTFALLLVVFLLQSVVGAVIQVPVALLIGGLSPGTQQLIGQALGAVSTVVVSPLSLIALTLVYYDLRIRKEAFDIEMLAASL